MTKKSLSRKLIYVLLFVIVFIAIMIYQYRLGTVYLDSDMAGEMVLAKLLNDEGSLMSKNWYYSTELRVFCESNLLKLGLFVFPHNWHAARVLVKGITLLILAIVFYFFGKKLELGDEAILGSIVLICPFGFWQAFHSVFGPFYTSHMIYLVVIYGLILMSISSKKRPVVGVALLSIVSLVAGMAGIRHMLMIFVPVFATAALLYFFKVRAEKKLVILDSFEGRALIVTFIGAFFNAVGCLLNIVVLSKIYSVGEMNKTWDRISFTELVNRWSYFLELFGFPDVSFHLDVLSVLGIVCGGIGIGFAALMVFSLVRLWMRRALLNENQRFIYYAFLVTLLIVGIAFSFMTGVGGTNGSYWLPIVPLAVGIVILELKTEDFIFAYSRRFVAIVIMCGVLLVSAGNTKLYVNSNFRHPKGIEAPVKWLVDEGFSNGYATFWKSDIIIEMTNGDIDVWSVDSLETLEISKWLQDKAHETTRPAKNIFILTYGEEDDAQIDSIKGIQDKLAYEDENGYRIYVFEDAEELAGYISVQ